MRIALAGVALIGVAMPAASCGGDLSNEAADSGSPKDARIEPADAGDSVDARSDANALSTCAPPAWVDPFEGSFPSNGQCVAARYAVSCMLLWADAAAQFSAGACISNDPTRCPENVASGAALVCHNHCEPNEYALQCGTPPSPVMAPPPPATCRIVVSAGEDPVYCCPCGS
jgi:hypothetical protein